MSDVIRNPLTALQNSIVSDIHLRLPMLNVCRPHYGRFTPEDLQEFRTKAPAVHVSLPAVREVEALGNGNVRASVKTVAIVITKDAVFEATDVSPKRKYKKEEAGLALVASLLIALPDFNLGAGVTACADIQADNLTGSKVFKEGVAMWGIHWINTLTLSDPKEEGQTLASLFYSHAPKIGVPHEPDYIEAVASVGGAL